MRTIAICGLAAAVALVVPAAGGTAPESPKAVDILFNWPHLDKLDKGMALKYRFERTVSDPKLLGEPFTDEVSVKIDDVTSEGRDVTTQQFTGDRAHEPVKSARATGNPVLLVFVFRAMATFNQLTGLSPPYLQPRFMQALRENAKVEATKIDYEGKSVDGYKVTVTPYVNDPAGKRLQGYDGAEFTFVVSQAVPGEYVEMVANYESSIKELPKLNERIIVAGAKSQTAAAQTGRQ